MIFGLVARESKNGGGEVVAVRQIVIIGTILACEKQSDNRHNRRSFFPPPVSRLGFALLFLVPPLGGKTRDIPLKGELRTDFADFLSPV
jgi:hypothetical protein